MFCKMCEIHIYSPGDIIDLKSGGVLFRGGLSELKQNADQAKKGMEKNGTSGKETKFGST